jgi:hypothetical protein
MGPGVEVGLTPNIMKKKNIFVVNVIKVCSYNYGRIIQVLWNEDTNQKNPILKMFEMISHSTLKF